MRGSGLPLLTLLIALISACTGTQARDSALRLSGCENFGGNFAVPYEQAQAALPDGFQPLSTTGGRNAGAVFYVIAVRCREGSLDGRELGPVQLAYAELPTTPSPDQQADGIADYTMPVLFTATPALVAAQFQQFDFGLTGPGTIDWLAGNGFGPQVQVSVGDVMLTLSATAPPEPASAFGAGEFILFGTQARTVTQQVLGYAGAADIARQAMQLESSGSLSLLQNAARTARGFTALDFELGFSRQD